jgi:hypothetical protein
VIVVETPPPLFVFTKVSSLGPAIKRFNRDVVKYLRDSKQEFHDVYGEDAFEDFAPAALSTEDGTLKVSPLALEFVRVTGLSFGDVYPDVLSELGAFSGAALLSNLEEEDAA